ncbi:hypothetical protein Ljam_1158 [Legionella jamestowniensis]|uniref:Uncharacterized protein n=1 Tax=Legionella jamestowniensis TaxID=455 RepID=A0A0W0UGG2_9GAMM|nr:hypothetical protein Ljam_1158 [Legionella jamestowniensis]
MPNNIRTPLTAQDLLNFHGCLIDLQSRQLAQHFANYLERKATHQNDNIDDAAMFAPFEHTINHVYRKLGNDVVRQIIEDIKDNNGLLIEEIVKNSDFQLLKKILEGQIQLNTPLPFSPSVTTGESSDSTKQLLAQLNQNSNAFSEEITDLDSFNHNSNTLSQNFYEEITGLADFNPSSNTFSQNFYEEITDLDDFNHHSIDGISKYQTVKLIVWCINMGASEQAIIDKIHTKLSELCLDKNITIEIEARFFYGSSLLDDKGPHKPIIEDNKIFKEYGITIEQLKDAVAYESQKNDNVLEIKILFSQTASCGGYSSASRGAKDTKNDVIFMQDFKTAYALLLPDIVIAENLPQAATQAKVHEQISELFKVRGENWFSQSTSFKHADFTATDRERNYVIATNFLMNKIELHPKPRQPEQYLFSQNEIKKYEPLRQIMTEKTKVTGLRLPINDTESFLKLLRTFLLCKHRNDDFKKHYLIISGRKCLEVFPKLNGEKRKDSKLQKGLSVKLKPKTGRITFTGYLNGKNKKTDIFEKHRLMHSKYKTPTLYGHVLNFSFWDKLRAPYIPELCLMQGMSKRFTEKLMLSIEQDDNFESPSNLIAMLSHSLSPKVVTPLLLHCILQKLVSENILPPEITEFKKLNDQNQNYSENNNNNNNNSNNKLPEKIEPSILSLSEDIDLDQYDLVEANLYAQDQHGNILKNIEAETIYLLRDKRSGNLLSKDIFFSSKPLHALFQKGYLGHYSEETGRKRKASKVIPQLMISLKEDQNESTLYSETHLANVELLDDAERDTTSIEMRSSLETDLGFFNKRNRTEANNNNYHLQGDDLNNPPMFT